MVSLDAIRHFVRAHGEGDAAVSWIATQQLALITTEQAQLAGLDRTGIARRLATGRLHHAHRGVYHVGHPKRLPRARELAGVLAVGRNAFASHASAVALWGLRDAPRAEVTVTVTGRHCRSRDSLIVHRTSHLAPADRRTAFGVPATAPARTLVDYAGVAPAAELERAVAEAFVRRLVTENEILAAAARAPNRAGVKAIRACLERAGGPAFTRSNAERLMLRLTRAADLPAPEVNASLAGFEVDFLWRAHRFVVEVDGYGVHGHRVAFERDRRKTLALTAAGYRVVRITWEQLRDEPVLVAVQIARALEHAA